MMKESEDKSNTSRRESSVSPESIRQEATSNRGSGWIRFSGLGVMSLKDVIKNKPPWSEITNIYGSGTSFP